MSSINLFERSQADNNKEKNNPWKFIVCTCITSFAYNKKKENESRGFISFDFYLAYTKEFEDK